VVMNTDAKIDGVQFRGISVVTPTFESDTPKYKVDQGFSITDHISINPMVFEIELTLYDGVNADGTQTTRKEQYNKIMQLWAGRKTFTFESDLGVFEDMVITRFSPSTTNKSANTFDCSLTIEKIIRATISLFETPVVTEPDGSIIEIGSISGSGTEVALTVVDSLPPEELSWAEQIVKWASEGW